jgi:hypothetical protein
MLALRQMKAYNAGLGTADGKLSAEETSVWCLITKLVRVEAFPEVYLLRVCCRKDAL